MKQSENSVLRECFMACSHRRIQILEPFRWNKVNPPPFFADDKAISGVAWRSNTGAASFGGKRMVRFGLPGQPDIQGLIRGGMAFGFECKNGKGKPSAYQSWFHGFFGGLGMKIAVVWNYQDAIDALDAWGVK